MRQFERRVHRVSTKSGILTASDSAMPPPPTPRRAFPGATVLAAPTQAHQRDLRCLFVRFSRVGVTAGLFDDGIIGRTKFPHLFLAIRGKFSSSIDLTHCRHRRKPLGHKSVLRYHSMPRGGLAGVRDLRLKWTRPRKYEVGADSHPFIEGRG